VLTLLGILTAVGIAFWVASVEHSGPSSFGCSTTPLRCGETPGSAITPWVLIGVVDRGTTVTWPTGLWIARICLAPVGAGLAAVLVLTVIASIRNLITWLDRRRRLHRMRRLRPRRSERRP
jgi:hypothetical protein